MGIKPGNLAQLGAAMVGSGVYPLLQMAKAVAATVRDARPEWW